MNTIELLPGTLAILIPDRAESWHLLPVEKNIQALVFDLRATPGILTPVPDSESVVLPPGEYEILFASKNCSEEQAAQVVENDIHPMLDYILGWRDYSFDFENCHLDTALESLSSLLKSKGLEPEKNYLLIRNTKGGAE